MDAAMLAPEVTTLRRACPSCGHLIAGPGSPARWPLEPPGDSRISASETRLAPEGGQPADRPQKSFLDQVHGFLRTAG